MGRYRNFVRQAIKILGGYMLVGTIEIAAGFVLIP
jgi:hypothetical protein